ncbi:hypothetical protein ACG98G_13105 [Megasphaera hexanoica]|uniref:Lipoprotein n=1 Tax=Megasphaera hexanoica TaxID=1675036 RepID=A0ABW7DKN5_9FIRM|nr:MULTISPECIES: hypothetical protein [Megasphaera]AXB82832.1 hypothetical protein ACT01_11635 [Megasphaera hexanoica]HAM04670.1 hypothetical protein [Megasphaera sp.]
MISKRIKIFGLILAGLCSLMLAGCGTGSDKVSTGYYKNVAIKPNGEFVIKDRVDDSKAKKGGIFYYVEMGKDDATKDKIVSVTAKAGNAPIDIHWKSTVGNMTAVTAARIQLDYSQDGYIKEKYERVTGKAGVGNHGEASIRYQIAKDGENKGKAEKKYYYNSEGDNNSLGSVAQAKIAYDKKGNIDTITYMNKDGKVVNGYLGASILGFVYDKEKTDVLDSIEIRDNNGVVKNNKNKYARIAFSYDKKGRVISRKLYNEAGDLDGSAQKSLFVFLGPTSLNDKLQQMKDGLIEAGAETKYTYDDKHAGPVKIQFLGIDGQAAPVKDGAKGVAELDMTYDDADRIIDLKFIGADGQSLPLVISNTKGPDELKMDYDENSNISQISYFKNGEALNIDEKVLSNGGMSTKTDIAAVKYKYDSQRNRTEAKYFDKSGNPTYLKLYGTTKYYGRQFEYSENNNNQPKVTYLDADGQAIKADPKDMFLGTWKEPVKGGYTWVVKKGTMEIIRPNGMNSSYSYELSNVKIDPETGKGSMILDMKGKNDFGVETLKFSDADHFEMVDTFNQSKLVRQKD